MHHNLDIHPIPDKPHFFINELDLADTCIHPNMETYDQMKQALENPSPEVIRVYIPLDLSPQLIMERMHELEQPRKYYMGEFLTKLDILVRQLEIYDQILTARNMSEAVKTENGHFHSKEGIELAERMLAYLDEFDYIEDEKQELKDEFGIK